MSGFEGSYLGDQARIDKHSALECGVCWWVYDPAKGDTVWQISPGTAFNDLPEHWRCPRCDAAQHQFMVLKSVSSEAGPSPLDGKSAEQDPLALVLQQIADAYQRVDRTMRSLPVYNDKLEVAVVGIRPWEGDHAAVVVTPWCMNIIVALQEDDGLAEGTTHNYSFPSGNYPVVRGFLAGVGAIESCSLFSPMEQFDSHQAAMAVAEEAMVGLFTSPEVVDEEPVNLSRRRFLRGGKKVQDFPSSGAERRGLP